MKLTKKEVEELATYLWNLENNSNDELTIDFTATCDLCGNVFEPVLTLENPNKAHCPHCDNMVNFERDE